MKTPAPPRSSRGKGKAEESAPSGDTPMARFQQLAKRLAKVDPNKVKEAEERAKRMRATSRKPKDG